MLAVLCNWLILFDWPGIFLTNSLISRLIFEWFIYLWQLPTGIHPPEFAIVRIVICMLSDAGFILPGFEAALLVLRYRSVDLL